MDNLCNTCGKCCMVIPFLYSVEAIRKLADNGDEEFKLLAEIFEPITKEEAIAINPALEHINQKWFYYNCRGFNKETKLCKIYETRPNICKGYPLYRKKELHKTSNTYIDDCGYITT